MQHLLRDERIQRFPRGLYWCILNSDYVYRLHPFVQELADLVGSSFHFVPIEGFDELLLKLWETVQAVPSALTITTSLSSVSAPPTFDLEIMDGTTLDTLDW